jgi:hypothetical protein
MLCQVLFIIFTLCGRNIEARQINRKEDSDQLEVAETHYCGIKGSLPI